jgi:hypothetical protein
VRWTFVELNFCLLLCNGYFGFYALQYFFLDLITGRSQAQTLGEIDEDEYEDGDLGGHSDSNNNQEDYITAEQQRKDAMCAAYSQAHGELLGVLETPLLLSGVPPKENRILARLSAWEGFYRKNIVRFEVARDVIVLLKALVSGVAIIDFMRPDVAVKCDAVQFSYQYTYDLSRIVTGNVTHLTATSCYRTQHNTTNTYAPKQFPVIPAGNIQHMHCKPELQSQGLVLAFSGLLAANLLLFGTCIIFKMCLVHNWWPHIRPFFTKNTTRLCKLLPGVAGCCVWCVLRPCDTRGG